MAQPRVLPQPKGHGPAPAVPVGDGYLAGWTPSLMLVIACNFVNAIEYAILMPTVWLYLEGMGATKHMLGITLAAYSLGRFLFFLPAGSFSDHYSMKPLFIATFALQMLGNAVYGVAGYFRLPWLAVAGRFVVGVGACNTTLTSAFIARTVAPARQPRVFALFMGSSLVGNVLGPAINAGLVHLSVRFWIVHLNTETAAGYLMLVVNAVLLLAFACKFRDPAKLPVQPQPQPQTHKLDSSGKKKKKVPHSGGDTTDGASNAAWYRVLSATGTWWCLVAAFCNAQLMSSLETVITPLTKENFGWGTLENSIMFGGIAFVALMGVVTSILLDKLTRSTPRDRVAGGLFITASALGVSVWFSFRAMTILHLMLFAGPFIFGLVFIGSNNPVIFSILVPPHRKGFFTAIQQMTLCFSRQVIAAYARVSCCVCARTAVGALSLGRRLLFLAHMSTPWCAGLSGL